jgi:hypothetical protein
MTKKNYQTVAILSLMLFASSWTAPVKADHPNPHGNGNGNHSHSKPNKPEGKHQGNSSNHHNHQDKKITTVVNLNTTQRNQLVDLVKGRTLRPDILSDRLRLDISNQVSSLPPGMVQRIVRGKGLPPGIAKKIYLPKTINTYLGLPVNYDVVVLGDRAVVLDAAKLVLDLIDIF